MRLSEIDLKKAYRAWHEAAGVFRCFVRASNFVSLKHYNDFELTEHEAGTKDGIEQVLNIMDSCWTDNTMVFIDLPDVNAIIAAIRLYRDKDIMPVITFNGLLHPKGVVGTAQYVSSLLLYSGELGDKRPSGYAFILDYNRFSDHDEEKLTNSFNNQYELSEEDLPSSEILRELGYLNVLYIYMDKPKDDMEAYNEYLEENGVPVKKAGVGGSQ